MAHHQHADAVAPARHDAVQGKGHVHASSVAPVRERPASKEQVGIFDE